jgi:hypothetical protein
MKENQLIKKSLPTIKNIALALFLIGWIGNSIWKLSIFQHLKMIGAWMVLGIIFYKLIYWKTYKNENKSNLIFFLIVGIIVLVWLII